MNLRQQFLQVLAPTTFAPVALQIERAEGAMLYDENGKSYIDLIGGISVCNIGHSNPAVIEAIHAQTQKYMHIMVYGELIQSPQVQYAKMLTEHLPASLNSVFFTNSGAEAVEGAMKLAKRATGRSQIIACNNSYHGSTQGALSLLGDEYFRNAYRPLLPDIKHIEYNHADSIAAITSATAAVFLEPIQAEGGVLLPDWEWIHAIAARCKEVGALLVFDEIQTGFYRTSDLFAHQGLDIVPDILLLGKALGGGLPLGAFICDKALMNQLADKPILGHITTFGGNPVCCAAGMAAFSFLLENISKEKVINKSQLFLDQLKHPAIRHINHKGMMMAIHLESFETVTTALSKGLQAEHAVFSDWFLFASNAIRIVPPLTISEEEITQACSTLLEIL